MAENNTAYGLGIVIFILSLVSLFAWMHNYVLYMIMYGIGTALFCVSGILYLVGGVKNNKETVGTGFGLGLPGWALIIISCILGIGWNTAGLEMINFQMVFWMFFLQGISDPFLYIQILPMMPSSRPYKVGYFGSIFHLPIAIAALLLGIAALNSVRQEKW